MTPAGKPLDLPDAPIADPDVPAPVRFLPPYDNVLVAYVERERDPLPELRSKTVTNADRRALLVDGFGHGWWWFSARGRASPSHRDVLSAVAGAADRGPRGRGAARGLGGTRRRRPRRPHRGIRLDLRAPQPSAAPTRSRRTASSNSRMMSPPATDVGAPGRPGAGARSGRVGRAAMADGHGPDHAGIRDGELGDVRPGVTLTARGRGSATEDSKRIQPAHAAESVAGRRPDGRPGLDSARPRRSGRTSG